MADTSSIWQSNNILFSELKGEALAAMGRLESAARAQVYNVVEYQDPGAVHTPGEYPSIDVNSLPTVDEVMGKVNAIVPDAFPTPPSADEITKYKRHVWEDSHLDSIQATIMAYISSMGMPDASFQDAIFNENRERRQQALNDDLDLINAKTSARGFKYANVMTAALINDLLTKDQFDREELNRQITKLMTEWARQNLQFSLQQGLAVEQAHMDFAIKYSSIYRELYMTQLNAVLEKYRTSIAMELGKLDAAVKIVAARADVLNANAGIVGKEDEAWFAKNKLEIDEAINRFNIATRQWAESGKIEVDAATAYASTAGNLVAAVTNSVLGITTK